MSPALMFRPVPACRSHGPHPLTIKQRLEAEGYTVSRSPFAYKRRITRGGAEVGHFTVEQACALLLKPAVLDVDPITLLAEIGRLIAAA